MNRSLIDYIDRGEMSVRECGQIELVALWVLPPFAEGQLSPPREDSFPLEIKYCAKEPPVIQCCCTNYAIRVFFVKTLLLRRV